MKNEPILSHHLRITTCGVPGPIYMPQQSRMRRRFAPNNVSERGIYSASFAQWTCSRNEFCAPYAPERTGKMPVPLQGAFTLIELLVVIAIIGILATLITGVISRATIRALKDVAVAEEAQTTSTIQEYRDRLGFYPPDNPNDPTMNPLWFELSGSTNNGLNYVTLDGSGQISVTDINAKFNRQGFANSGTKAHSTDESGAPISFLSQLSSKQVAQPDSSQPLIKILSCSVGAPPGTNVNVALCVIASHA